MAGSESFDPAVAKTALRAEWQKAAAGYRKWYDVLEAAAAGQVASRALVELAGIGPGDTVLDVATGYGEPALTAARAVAPGGRVVATDIAGDFLAVARERAARAGIDNVEFVEADAEGLAFDEETFEAVVSRQGLQFLSDVAGTLRRLRSLLKRDGRLAAAVWGPPQKVQFAVPIGIVFEELELPLPPPGRPGIFALADADALTRLVADAGFRNVETGTVTVVYETSSPEDFTRWLQDLSPPLANLLKEQPPAVQERVWRMVTDAWAPFVTPAGRVRTENQTIWVTAER